MKCEISCRKCSYLEISNRVRQTANFLEDTVSQKPKGLCVEAGGARTATSAEQTRPPLRLVSPCAANRSKIRFVGTPSTPDKPIASGCPDLVEDLQGLDFHLPREGRPWRDQGHREPEGDSPEPERARPGG